MSIIWTNIQFVEDIVDSIQKTEHYSQFERYMKFGTQLSNIGYLHTMCQAKTRYPNNINFSFEHAHDFLFDIVQNVKNKPRYVQAFVFGFVTQHILGQKIKPYMEHLKRKVDCSCINIEAYIDTLIMKKTYNISTWKTPVYNEFNIGLFVDKHIVNLLKDLKYPLAHSMQKAYMKFNVALRYYFDPFGWKSKLLPSYCPIYSSYTYTQNGFDVLNEGHKSWYNDVTKEMSTMNFFQVYEAAKLEATAILSEVHNFWNNPHRTFDDDLKQLLTLPYNELSLTHCS